MASFKFNTPFTEQLEFFRNKVNLPSERWDDIKKSAHDKAFIVAGATKADLINDLRTAVDKAISEGKSLQWFRSEFDNIVKANGWTGWTGEGTKAGRDWRTRIIYQTNMNTSYAAGRWAQLNDPDLLLMRPYWRYVHADGVRHPRPHHLSWHGITLKHDDVFWKTHFAPNGWLCHCRIEAASAKEFETAQGLGKGVKPEGYNTLDVKTGEVVGIDKGFGYAPGENATASFREVIQKKLISYPPALTKALTYDLNRYIDAHTDVKNYVAQVLADHSIKYPLWLGFIENYAEIKAVTGIELTGYSLTLPAEAPRHIFKSHQYDGNGQRAATAVDYEILSELVRGAQKIEKSYDSSKSLNTILFNYAVGGEVYRAVFEVRTGKASVALALKSLVIKTK